MSLATATFLIKHREFAYIRKLRPRLFISTRKFSQQNIMAAAKPPSPPFSSTWTQFRPPKPEFTEKNVPDLFGKVYIVTGSNTGVGKELAQILYSKNAKVYILARSQTKASQAIEEIKTAAPRSKGSLIFLHLDLADLSTIKSTVSQFTSRETKLHVLFNNAGLQNMGKEISRTAQGYEIHIGVNVLGTFLLTKLLTPLLLSTAKLSETQPNTVRVVWVSSSGTELLGEKSIGLNHESLKGPGGHETRSPLDRYALSKAGNWLHAVEYAKRVEGDGVVSVPLNPGNLHSDLYRDWGFLLKMVLRIFVTHPPIKGAYTELFAGLSPQVDIQKSGDWVIPWGRFLPIRADLVDATKTVAEGGNGHAEKFWEWSEEQVKPYL